MSTDICHKFVTSTIGLLTMPANPIASMSSEEKAREQIDAMLVASGWAVQDYAKIDFSAGRGIALREVPLKSGTCDYLAAPAFELNLIALYYLKILGRSVTELRELAAAHCRHGCELVRNALEAAARTTETQMPPVVFNHEPDATPEPTS